MNSREDRVVIEIDTKDIEILKRWKRLCLLAYGIGGIRKRFIEVIKEDFEKIKKEAKI